MRPRFCSRFHSATGLIRKYCIGSARWSLTLLWCKASTGVFSLRFSCTGVSPTCFSIFSRSMCSGPPLERSIGAVRFAVCYLISGLASSAGVVAFDRNRTCSGSATRRRVGMHHGHSRRLGGILAATSTRAARKTATRQRPDDCRDTNGVRSLNTAGEHGGAPLRISCRICP